MSTPAPPLAARSVLVTGANRGIGAALVTEALARGAATVYAGARSPMRHADPRVVPVQLDVTHDGDIAALAGSLDRLDLLVNNAGVFEPDGLEDRAALDRHLSVNLFGTWSVTRALLPAVVRARGAVVNNVSLMALAPLPITPAYSASKAAALSLTQSLRALLAAEGVRVHAVLTGPTDTDMVRALAIPKASPAAVAAAILDAVAEGVEDIFPDPLSHALADGWYAGPAKSLERQNAALVA